MKVYDDLTDGLRAILMHWTRGYRFWTATPPLPRERALHILRDKWAIAYGTGLPAWKRQDRKQKGWPNAVGLAIPVVGAPERLQLILLVTEEVLNVTQDSPFSREQWSDKCVEISDYVIVHEPRERGDYAWTWRLQERVQTSIQFQLTKLVSAGRAAEVHEMTFGWIRFYPMFGGIRRQIRRMLGSARKLWMHKQQSPWPGPDPENLPAMIGFKKPGSRRRPTLSAED